MEEATGVTREGNISLILESYNDIFSDFDPRSYSARALSEDFLEECRRAAREREVGIELRLLVPVSKRHPSEEIKIKRRLKHHFQKHFHEKQRAINHERRVGMFWVFLGTLIMICTTFVYKLEGDSFFLRLLVVVLEPAGWFTFWEGLHQVFLEYKHKLPSYNFYKKLANVEIKFESYQA